MHDFDYDAMQKKRIAKGAIHKKNGSKNKKCSLPHDGLTPAQLRRLNGPVHTYKLDEPMTWKEFKAMPADLQKKYILNLQELYRANDVMLGMMFGVGDYMLRKVRAKLGIDSLSKARLKDKEREILYAKWDAFCNGVVGGGHKEEVKEEPNDEPNVEVEEGESWSTQIIDTLKDRFEKPEKAIPEPELIRPIKSELEFVADICDANDIANLLRNQCLPAGKCRIKIEIEQED